MRADGNKPKVHQLLLEQKIIAEKEYEQAQQSITATACSIAKGLQRHEFAKRSIKKINNRYNKAC